MPFNQPINERASKLPIKHRKGDRTDYDADELEFMVAMERFMREHAKPYPDARDVLAVIRSLGYER